MDNILEILIPLAIAAVYFFGNMFSGKSEENEERPPSLPRQRGGQAEDDIDVHERQRRIQEDIRRKIMERRGGSGSEPPRAAPAGDERQERRSVAQAPREISEAQKHTREVVHETRDDRATRRDSGDGYGYEATPPAFSWDESHNAYDSGMQAQLKRIEATKRQAEKLKKQAARRRKPSKNEEKGKRRTGGYFSGTVRESLQDPQAARVAFIYGEVLGPPIGLRKGSSSVPGLA